MKHILAQSLQIPWGTGETSTTIQGPLKTFGKNITLGSILSTALSYIFFAAGFGVLLMLLAGGFTYMTSGGDPKKTESAKGQLTNALIGFVIIFVAFWLVQAAGYIFGIQAINGIFGQ